MKFPAFLAATAVAACQFALSAATPGAMLEVGPGKPFQRIEVAYAQAVTGDVILVHPRPDGAPYERVAVYVRRPGITVRGVLGPNGQRVKLSGRGFDYSGSGSVPRAIIQFNPGTDDCTLEGFDLSGAHNGSHNGAGVRINQANRVTVCNCEIHDNDMGIMSNGDGTPTSAINQQIERCLIHHNGAAEDPGYNHNLYLGGTSVTLRFCEVHSSLTGHNVKSRAHHTRVEFSYIHDSSNREFDLVDAAETSAPGSHAVLLGNVIVKDPNCKGNRTVIHFGQDGGKDHNGTLFLVHNTIVTPFIGPVVHLDAKSARAYLAGNIVWDAGANQRNQVLAQIPSGGDAARVSGTGNWLAANFGTAGTSLDPVARGGQPPFAAPARGDYHLAQSWQGTFAAGTRWTQLRLPPVPGGATGTSIEDALVWQYRHPADGQKRPRSDSPDLGAYEYEGK